MKKLLIIALLALGSHIQGQTVVDNVKVMTYNLLQYGITTGPGGCAPASTTSKNAWLQIIAGNYKPDILAVNELRWSSNNAYANNIRINALTYNTSMKLTASSNVAGSDIANMLFYNSDKFGHVSSTAITGLVRDIDVHKLYHKNATIVGDTTFLWCLVAHLKAGNTSADANSRGLAAQAVMNWLNAHPSITNYIIMGDLNLYSSTEAAYTNFTNPADAMRFYDPSGVTTGWQGSTYKNIHTQSPRLDATGCGTTGGMDDRFDFILNSAAIKNNTDGISINPGTYKAYGNDGVSYNVGLNCASTTSVSATICSALQQLSDHIPVVMELAIPYSISGIEDAAPKGVHMQVLENPVTEDALEVQFSFDSRAEEKYECVLTDLMGKTNIHQSVSTAYGNQTVHVDVRNLAKGIYFLTLKDQKGHYLTEKIVVQ